MKQMAMEDHKRGSRDFHKGKMSNEERERNLAVMRVQLEVLQGWLQEKKNGYRRHGWKMRKRVRWKLLEKIWNVILISEFTELEKRHIDFLEKQRLKGVESQQKGSNKTQKVYCEGLVFDASNEALVFLKVMICV